MLISLKQLTDFELYSVDGKAGRINDTLFDRKDWSLKYIVDKSSKLLSREIAVSYEAIAEINWQARKVYLRYSQEQIRQSPSVKAKKSLNDPPKAFRRQPVQVFHYDWVMNREETYNNEFTGTQEEAGSAVISDSGDYTNHSGTGGARYVVQDEEYGTPVLQSTDKAIGLKISTKTGDLGVVEDFIVDDSNWLIQFMIIATQKNLRGKRILVAPEAISWINWKQKHITVDLDKEKLAGCPNFNLLFPLVNDSKKMLYEQYECLQFWKE